MEKIALVVDDNSFIRKNIKKILQELDFKIYEADNGVDAVIEYKKIRPSIVVMDINMPHQNGLDSTRKIIEFDKDANVLICSSMLFLPHYQNKSLEVGAKSLLSKPFTEMELIEALNNLLERGQ